jgi:glycosyltransferase involved in cell wall biosynthesis
VQNGLDISVVISTYNRCALLKGALENLLRQSAQGVRYEVIIVDNNSNDQTRAVVERLIPTDTAEVKYIFEPRQGISYARNTGIAHARSPVIAFTDDDVRVAHNWIASIKQTFDEYIDADFVGGRILPRWKTTPPPWLTRDHWWPLALLDFGERVLVIDSNNPICLPTANAAFRRHVFTEFGLFSPAFSGREDHEFLLRLWLAGRRGVYAPDIVATAEVQSERLKPGYHRKWNMTTGRFNSLMHLNEKMGPDGRLIVEQDCPRLFGTPAHVYKSLIAAGLRWITESFRGRESMRLQHQNHVWYLIGYIRTRYAQHTEIGSNAGEVVRFVRGMIRRQFYKAPVKSESLLHDAESENSK